MVIKSILISFKIISNSIYEFFIICFLINNEVPIYVQKNYIFSKCLLEFKDLSLISFHKTKVFME